MLSLYSNIIKRFLTCIILFASINAVAQISDGSRQGQVQFFSHLLSIEKEQAARIAFVFESYKEQAQNIADDKSTTQEDKNAKLTLLIKNRDAQLSLLITKAQFKLIAQRLGGNINNLSERDSLEKNASVRFYNQKLNVDANTALKIRSINDIYKAGVKSVMNDTQLSEFVKRAKIDQLIEEKYKELGAILTPAQLDIIVPERKVVKQYSRPFTGDKELTALQDTLKKKIHLIYSDNHLSGQVKSTQVALLLKIRDNEIEAILAKRKASVILQSNK